MSDEPFDPAWAWAPYRPDAARPWDLRRASHLLRRAGFGGNWAQLAQAVADGPEQTVAKLLQPAADVPAFNRQYDAWEASTGNSDSLRAWWLRRMIQTPHPLLEKLTLFWHHYFGISQARVQDGALMAQHVQRLRTQALGRFDALLESLLQDPALFLGLDAAQNRKAMPQEHLARVLLEQYTVGPGVAAPGDVRDLSRALTGWSVLRGRLRFVEREHDTDELTILGRCGRCDAPQAVRVLLADPHTPRFVVRRLYRELIAERDDPPEPLLAPLAEAFGQDYDVAKLVGTMLRSNLFFSPAVYRRRIKSPVEFTVGLIRSLEGMLETVRLGQDVADLGQHLYHPPTVHGWPGGTVWVQPALMLGRQNLAAALLSESGPYGGKLDPWAIARRHGRRASDGPAPFLIDLFFGGDLPEAVRQCLLEDDPAAPAGEGEAARYWRQVAHRAAALLEYQLA